MADHELFVSIGIAAVLFLAPMLIVMGIWAGIKLSANLFGPMKKVTINSFHEAPRKEL